MQEVVGSSPISSTRVVVDLTTFGRVAPVRSSGLKDDTKVPGGRFRGAVHRGTPGRRSGTHV